MKEPIYVTKPFLPPFEEFTSMLKEIWQNDILTNNGPMHVKLEGDLKSYLQADNLTLFVNGHQALEIALKALDLKGEVITTPFTFASTTHAIVRSGLIPVFSDIKLSDYNLDEEVIEESITPRTCAILPVHVYGNPCKVDEIDKIAKKHNLRVIYDSAHAFGVKLKNRPISSFGDINMFSFHATKVFNTIEGGALVTNLPELTARFNLLKNFGIINAEEIVLPGTNAKMNEFQSLMGLLNLQYVDNEIYNRSKKVEKYRSALSQINGIKLIEENDEVQSNFAYMPILILDSFGISRNELFEILKNHNIFSRKYFYPLLSNFDIYKKYIRQPLLTANFVAERILCLPLWGSMKDETIEEICQIIYTKK